MTSSCYKLESDITCCEAYFVDEYHLKQAHFSQLPPSLAQFSPTDPDIVVYTGYGMQKAVQFYSLAQKKVPSFQYH